jgi:hypothetical protein
MTCGWVVVILAAIPYTKNTRFSLHLLLETAIHPA